MNLKYNLKIAALFLLAGGLLSSQQFIQHFENTYAQPFMGSSKVEAAPSRPNISNTPGAISGEPVHISIPSQNISIDIEPGYYNAVNKTWTLSTTKAEFAEITSQPNNVGGNTFIYGHNRASVFKSLLGAKTGDMAIVTTSNGHTFTYELVEQHDTDPSDVSLFNYQGKPILTLQTCSGLWYQNRHLFTFDLVKAV
jgi:LPXTG-site transpeptidase (sortase) family protein